MNTQTFTFGGSRLSTLSTARKEGVISILRTAQERVSSTTRSWPDPELSIGHYIGKAGWDQVWEAVGPARDAFNKIAPEIKSYLESAVEPVSSRVIWSMYMIGKVKGSAAPFIMFCCEVLEHRRAVRNTIKESGILNGYPGIKTGHLRRPPDFNQLMPLARGDTLPDNSGSLFMLRSSQSNSACGSQLFLPTDGEDPRTCSAKATIGGVIRVRDDYYYTTAAHALQSDSELIVAYQSILPEQEDYVVDDDAFSLDGSHTTDSATTHSLIHHDTRGTDPGLDNVSITFEDASTTDYQWDEIYSAHQGARVLTPTFNKGPVQRRMPFAEKDLEQLRARSAPPTSGHSPSPIGRPCITSMDSQDQAAGLDYALIQVSTADHTLDNAIKVGGDGQSIVKVQCVVRSEPQLENVEIIAATSRGVMKGYLSGTPSYSSAPGRRSYNKMFKASLDGPLQRGDCGTWVIDAKCGDLYGHIIAGSPGEGVALIVPFTDIFEDIHNKLGQSPCLPMAGDDTIDRKTSDHSVDTKVQDEDATEMPQFEGSSDNSVTNDIVSETTNSINMSTIASSYEDEGTRSLPHKALGEARLPHGMSPEPWSKGIGKQLARLMEKRLDHLKRGRRDSQDIKKDEKHDNQEAVDAKGLTRPNPVPPSPSYNSLRNRALTQTALLPEDSTAYGFWHLLHNPSWTPIDWENPGHLYEALQDINLDEIFFGAQRISNVFRGVADRTDNGRRPEWGYQDYVIQALLIYFQQKFFTWVNSNPSCENCELFPTIKEGETEPDPEERARGARVVELYRCTNVNCSAEVRFPRYLDVWTLMQTRKGRVEEWANCFGMLCRALGSRVRWVWNAEDYMWTEVYSKHQKRWVHVDVCAGAWDEPQLYTEGWGRKISYCIAFSVDGATDVTRRYVRSPDCALPRTKCTEEVLLYIMREIKTQRRMNMSEEERFRLENEDAREAIELQSYVVESLASDVSRLTTGGPSSSGSSKAVEQRDLSKPDDVKRVNAETSISKYFIEAHKQESSTN